RVRRLIDMGALVGVRAAYRPAHDLQRPPVPPTVSAVLATRIDKLPPEDKQVLQAAAVIGKDVPYSLLQAITNLAEADLSRAIERLQAAEFVYEARLVPDLAYTFKHALTHEVAYGSLRRDQQRALHATIVSSLEALYPDRLIEHVDRLATRLGDQRRLAMALTLLGNLISMTRHSAEARTLAQRALDVADSLRDLRLQVRATYTLGVGYDNSGHYRQAEEALGTVVG